MEELRPGQRAPALELPYVTEAGLAQGSYDLRRELGLVVVLGFCPELAEARCAGYWQWAAKSRLAFGARVSLVLVTGSGAGAAAEFAAREGGGGRILLDDRLVASRRWGGQGGVTQGLRVYLIGAEGAVSYRDLQFDPAVPQSTERLEEAVRGALGWSGGR